MTRIAGIELLVAPTLVYGPLSAALAAACVVAHGPLAGAASFGLGLVLWTVGEYLVHRFVEHGPFRRMQYVNNHARHHSNPDDARHFVYPLARTLPMLPLVLGWSWLLHWEPWGAFATSGGITFGYLVNEWLHLCSHRPQLLARWPLLDRLTRNHRRHHHENSARHFGFYTSLWDRVFDSN